MKRLFDIVFSGIVLLVLSPVLVIVIVILKLTGENEAFYLQERIGFKGMPIFVTKFVTMVRNSENLGAGEITLRDDPRVLPIGKILRKTKLNEIPQFWDVFVGKLSLVGWRPLLAKGFQDYSEEVRREIVMVKPGLTGIGSLVFRDEESIIAEGENRGFDARECYREEIMAYKGDLERWYAANANLWTDVKIIVATAVSVLRSKWFGYRTWFSNLPTPKTTFMQDVLSYETNR